MLFLLDANVLIDANRDYYPITRVPEFWEWLTHNGTEGHVKIPLEVYEEIKDGSDDLGNWARNPETKSALLFDEEAEPNIVAKVVDQGYASDLADDEVDKLGRDPFLIAYGLAAADARCVVSTEVSKPKRERANRHIPDVCLDLGVVCLTTFEFVRELDFRTGWRST